MGITEFVEKKKQEEKEREESFSRIAEEFTPGVADALRAHFAIYDERFYLWLADLYDPGKYDDDGNPLGGGFYYSNSARDNEGLSILLLREKLSRKQIVGIAIGIIGICIIGVF